MGTLLLFCGGGIAIDSFHSLQSIWMETNIPCFWGISSLEKETQLAVAASIAGVSITAKELLYRVTIRIGKRINSKVFCVIVSRERLNRALGANCQCVASPYRCVVIDCRIGYVGISSQSISDANGRRNYGIHCWSSISRSRYQIGISRRL